VMSTYIFGRSSDMSLFSGGAMWGACFISDEDRVHYPHYTTILFCSFISWTYFITQTY